MYKIIGADHIEYGPVTSGQLGEWIAQGRANAASLVWGEGATEWKPLAAIPEFAAALGSVRTTPATIGPTIALPPKTNGLAITGLILGILSIPFFFCLCLFSVLGIIFSGIGLVQIRKSHGQETGNGLAITGIVLSCLGLLMGVTVFLLFYAAAAIGNMSN
jgi:hypothetical protein